MSICEAELSRGSNVARSVPSPIYYSRFTDSQQLVNIYG